MKKNNKPDTIEIKLGEKSLLLRYLGEFQIKKDNSGQIVSSRVGDQKKDSYLLCIKTDFTEKGNPESIDIIPDKFCHILENKYFDIKKLDKFWHSPGIYVFAVKNGKDLKYSYVGRASNSIISRIKGYLWPGPTQTTNINVNRIIYNISKEDKKVLIYFYPEKDTEKELQRLLKPEWNIEK